jgi:hypothetical protein
VATLAEQIQAICDEHGLTVLGFNYTARTGTYYAFAHGGDLVGGSGDQPTPRDAIGAAIRELNSRRATDVSVPELEAA